MQKDVGERAGVGPDVRAQRPIAAFPAQGFQYLQDIITLHLHLGHAVNVVGFGLGGQGLEGGFELRHKNVSNGGWRGFVLR
ncbi:MAG: hypothetical protein Q7U71_09520 [bacterium]|nr:hypothetical protein [bacterium]